MTSNKRGPKPGVAQRLKQEIKQLETELATLRNNHAQYTNNNNNNNHTTSIITSGTYTSRQLLSTCNDQVSTQHSLSCYPTLDHISYHDMPCMPLYLIVCMHSTCFPCRLF